METTIEIGDFIKSSISRFMCGFVITVGSIRFGRGMIPAYRIRLASGREELIIGDDAVFISRKGCVL